MPYLNEDQIEKMHKHTSQLGLSRGEMNFILTELVLTYLEGVPINYNSLAKAYEMIPKFIPGLLSKDSGDTDSFIVLKDRWEQAARLAQMEFYRRVLAPYEDIKIQENGDLYSDIVKRLPRRKD